MKRSGNRKLIKMTKPHIKGASTFEIKALQEIELKFRAWLEYSSDVVFCVDRNGIYNFVNKVFADTFGKTPEYFCGKSFWDVYSKEHADQRYEAISKVFQTGEVGTADVVVPLPDRNLYFHATINPVKDLQGNVTLVLTHSINITESREAAAAQRRSAEIQSVLREIAEAAILTPSTEALYPLVHRMVGRVLPAKLFHINLLDAATGEIVVPYQADGANFIPSRRLLGKGLTEYIMHLGHTVNIPPAEMDHLREIGEYTLGKVQNVQLRHYLGAPLIDSKGKAFGVMSLIQMGETQAFNPEDAEILSIIAAQVAQAIERKQAEEKLRESEKRYRFLVEASNEGIWSMDGEHRTTFVNQAMADMLGYAPTEMQGKKVEEYFFPEDRVFHENRMTGRRKGEDEVYERRFRRRDGSTLWAIVSAKALTDDKRNFAGSFAMFTDITERKRAEEALRESEQRYRAIMHDSSDAIALVDAGTKKFIEVNGRWLSMMGYEEDEIPCLTAYDTVDKKPEEIDRDYDEILRNSGASVTIRRVRRKDGRIVEVEWSAAVIELAGRRTLLFSSRDLSAERKLQEQILNDVALAAEVQKTLVPQSFDDLFIAVKTIYAPYHMVSGDFYDCAWSSDQQRFSGFVLDIAGHGVASSLQGIAVSTYFRDVLESPMGLDAKLSWINQRVLQYFTDETFAAAIVFEFDFSRQLLRFATAGIYGFLCSSSALPELVKEAGSLIGITEAAEFTECSVPIQPGDAFYFMSDGIYDQLANHSNLIPGKFDQTVSDLRELSSGRNCRDDCCAVCILVKEKASFPFLFKIYRYGDYHRIRARLRDLVQRFAGSAAGRITVAMGEALNNAARESMDVRVKVSLFRQLLVVRVRDGGRGFDGQARIAALRSNEAGEGFEERLFAERGRGILIMVSWMDQVIYNRKGNEVMLVKRLVK